MGAPAASFVSLLPDHGKHSTPALGRCSTSVSFGCAGARPTEGQQTSSCDEAEGRPTWPHLPYGHPCCAKYTLSPCSANSDPGKPVSNHGLSCERTQALPRDPTRAWDEAFRHFVRLIPCPRVRREDQMPYPTEMCSQHGKISQRSCYVNIYIWLSRSVSSSLPTSGYRCK